MGPNSPQDRRGAPPDDVESDRPDDDRESGREHPAPPAEMACGCRAGDTADRAAGKQQKRDPPVNQAGKGIVGGRGGAEAGHRNQRRSDGIDQRHAGCNHQAGDDQEAAADAEETGEEAGGQCGGAEPRKQFARRSAIEADLGISCARRPAYHRDGDHNHDDAEQRQQPLAVDGLAGGRADSGASNAEKGVGGGAAHFDGARAPMAGEVDRSIGGNRQRAGPNGHVGALHADDIDQQRHGQH